MSIAIDHRPDTLDNVIGNAGTIRSIKALFENRNDKLPHAYLITGPSGCGKTTLGRIISSMLGASSFDFCEIDTADFRGIDTIRDIRKQVRLLPQDPKSTCRVWLIDECFFKDTLVNTPNGNRKICNLKIGDSVFSINGESPIENIFINNVSLDRVIKILLSNGKYIYTTKQHLFFTNNGWVEAEKLIKNDFIFHYEFSNMVVDENLLKEVKNEKLSILRNGIQGRQGNSNNLFKILCSKIKEQNIGVWPFRKKRMQILQNNICLQDIFNKNVLLPDMCWEMEFIQTGTKTKNVFETIKGENFKGNSRKNEKPRNKKDSFGENVEKQSNEFARNNRKNEKYKKNKRDIKCLEWFTRGKWNFNGTANSTFISSWMENGICSIVGWAKNWISNKLQNRYCKRKVENRDRGRWEWPQIEKEYIERCKKKQKC